MTCIGWLGEARGEFFGIQSATHLRADSVGTWSGFSPVHGTAVPDFAALPTAGNSDAVLVLGASQGVSIYNQPGADMPGVLGMKSTSGGGGIYFYPSQLRQGFGITVERLTSGPATYSLAIFTGGGVYVGSTSITVPDASVPTFIGCIDPEARIGIVALNGGDSSPFLMSNPTFQIRYTPTVDPAFLPAAGTETVQVKSTATYLHQGYAEYPTPPDAPTLTATIDNDNAYDLKAWFPTLRTGDVLAFERKGSPYAGGATPNQLLAVLSSTQELLGGREFRRVPGALEAGRDYPTASRYSGNITTPTNIAQDFLIGDRTYIEVPDHAQYVFFSREIPAADATPMSVTVSHIPRQVFNAWVVSQGLVGSLAQPGSDLDGDGLTLLEEFAFQKDPTRQDAGERVDYSFTPVVETSGSPARLRLLFGGRRDGPVRYGVEVSDDLRSWQRLPDSAVSTLLTQDGSALFSASDPTPGPRRFGRVVLEYLAP